MSLLAFSFIIIFVTGYLSDVCLRQFPQKSTGSGRHYVIAPCFACVWLSVVILRTKISSLNDDITAALVLAFVVGACNYTCINVLGVLSLENVDDEIAGMDYLYFFWNANQKK